ncbi:hypothetical protein C8R46DRAFT_1233031 [Mycena filopes]|nr:hypothetical protein C8R46DRAFT_1233031 [Mycena filopes]
MVRELPGIVPVEVRKVPFNVPEEAEMSDVSHKDKPSEETSAEASRQSPGRQSEITATVDREEVMDRILDVQVPLSLRELMVTSKDLRNEFQDLIKVKNICAVLLNESPGKTAMAGMNWPRSDRVLIKVEMETNGQPITAIIDRGSQLDVVRADTAALTIWRAVDMTQATGMKDANGGLSQLQGWIRDVEFNCGGAITTTDLWISQQAPFELLLGRPWQQGNLMNIDERVEGPPTISCRSRPGVPVAVSCRRLLSGLGSIQPELITINLPRLSPPSFAAAVTIK